MLKKINGILLLDKPPRFTSNQALQRIKRLFQAKKAGHTGSLDPIATGMLPICFGEATKFSQFLLDSNKSYRVTAKLGVETTTGDTEGEVTVEKPLLDITLGRVAALLNTYLGEIEQIPPMFSAIKYQGKPLYQLARRGISVERKPRRIQIFSLEVETLIADQLTFTVHCSKGTYVRTLVEDIGRALDCGAHVIALHRVSVTPYDGARMYTLASLEALEKETPADLANCLLPVETALQVFPEVKLSIAAAYYLKMGQSIRATLTMDAPLVRLTLEDGRFIGVGKISNDGRIQPHRLLESN